MARIVGEIIIGGPAEKEFGFEADQRNEPITRGWPVRTRPGRLASRTTTEQADIDGTLTFDSVPGGTRMRWSWTVRPRGARPGCRRW